MEFYLVWEDFMTCMLPLALELDAYSMVLLWPLCDDEH